MYKRQGYIYKGSKIINWCPVCQTTISDAEVIHEEQDGFFWHINYPIVGEEGRFVEIATTRPETMLGATAVAVNPEDERYQDCLLYTSSELEVILDGQKEIPLTITPQDPKQRRTVTIHLDGFPDRPEKTTRVRCV